MARVTPPSSEQQQGDNYGPSPSLLQVIDGWLRDAAIRRSILIAFLASLATLVAIVALSGPLVLGCLLGPLLGGSAGLATFRRARRASHRQIG